MSKIDFSYKKNALRVTYDVESTPNLFTLAMIHDKALSLIFFGDEQFDNLTNEELINQMKNFAKKEDTLKDLNISSHEELEYNLYRYTSGDEESMNQFRDDLALMVTCKPLKSDRKYTNDYQFVEYCGWNSAKYDMPLLVLIKLLLDAKGKDVTPKDIRHISNLIIKFNDRDWKFPEFVETETAGLIKQSNFKLNKNLALWSDGHIDWAKIAKKTEDGSEGKVMPPGLKKEMARFGKDIIIDESVASDDEKIWTDEERADLVDYNFNDVLGTKVIGQNSFLEGELRTRDKIRESYPYTAAQFTPMDKLASWVPEERDVTAARLAGLVLIGEKRIKPKDWSGVQYTFPIPNPEKENELYYVDLWEEMKKKEKFIHPYLIQFFDHFRGKDTTTSWDNQKVTASQPITGQSAMNIPYFRNGKPVDSFARVSMGGAHGSIMAGLRHKTDEEINTWIRTDSKLKVEEKPTIDLMNVVHLDWASFYPMMASKMKIYMTQENVDRYTGIIEDRVKVKGIAKEIEHNGKMKDPNYDKWQDPAYIETEEDQMGLKFVLNNATGAGNMHQKYALLPLDNKTLSMRLVGNMLIWCLGQRLTEAGAFVISTNTDGLYITNMTVEEASVITEQYIKDYGMVVEPEHLARFINRDTSNRIEFEYSPDSIDKVGGTFRHATKLTFSDRSMGDNVAYPLIAANAAMHYMTIDYDWLTKPYDKSILYDYMQEILNGPKIPSAWFHTYIGTSSRRLLVNNIPQQKINRIVLTKNGDLIENETNVLLKREEYVYIWNQIINGAKTIKELRLSDNDKEEIQFTNGLNLYANIENIQFDFVKKYVEYDGAPEEYLPLNQAKVILDYEEAKELGKKIGLKTLGYYNPDLEKWLPIKAWKKSKMTHYTSNVGKVLNLASELEEFDYSQLDIDAYVRWSEELLSNWKATADLPEVGMSKCDDTVIPTKVKKRVTKLDEQIEILRSYYNFSEEID